jgi:hypothetical protein
MGAPLTDPNPPVKLLVPSLLDGLGPSARWTSVHAVAEVQVALVQ